MAYTTIDKPSDYFNTVTYTGDMVDGDGTGHTQSITGVGFQPNWVWHKGRSGARTHILVDSVRGTSSYNWLISNSSSPEITANDNGAIKSIDSNGITLENGADSSSKSNNAGKNGETYVFWNWLAGTSFTNDASSTGIGTIDSTGSFNNDSGFSIVSYTNTNQSANSGVATIKHGLNTTPNVMILKDRDATSDWQVFHSSLPTNKYLDLNTTDAAAADTNVWNNTAPTSSVFTVGDNSYSNPANRAMIAYVFAEKKGYSKFGSYTGNGNADGTFVYTGFKPAWVMYKNTSQADDWFLSDSKRLGYNPDNHYLRPSLSAAEGDPPDRINLFSNGFKLTTSDKGANASDDVYIYMAFAENPFVTSTGVPATAR